MNTLTIDLNENIDDLAPEDLQSIRHAVREMVQLAKRKSRATASPSAGPVRRYEIKARPLGLRPGLSYDQTGNLLSLIEGDAWK